MVRTLEPPLGVVLLVFVFSWQASENGTLRLGSSNFARKTFRVTILLYESNVAETFFHHNSTINGSDIVTSPRRGAAGFRFLMAGL